VNGRALVVRAHAARLPLASGSVHLVVTSPPFYGLRDYRDCGESLPGQLGHEPDPDQFIAALAACTAEWARVLAPDGSMFVNLGDSYYSAKGSPGPNGHDPKQAARRGWVRPLDRSGMGYPRKTLLGIPARYHLACLRLGLLVRQDIVWAKGNPTPDRGALDRCPRVQETIFHLTKRPRYFHDPAAIGQAGSVWAMRPDPLVVPPGLAGLAEGLAPYPLELARRAIAGWCPDGGTVLDPFGGSGTAALQAVALGRTGITADLSHGYCKVAAWRVADPGERARALQVARPPLVPPGQIPLFEDSDLEGLML
jgi:DNA modification methylase